MSSMFAKVAFIGLTAIGALAATIGPAAAQSNVGFSLFVGSDRGPDYDEGVAVGPPRVMRVWGDDYGRYDAPPPPPYWARRHHWDGPRYAPPPSHWGGPPEPRFSGLCVPGDAIHQARRNGLHDPFIERVTPRSVIVGGRRYGGFDRIILINRPGCPYVG